MENVASSLTPLGLFMQAGPVAKAVFLLLLAASIWCLSTASSTPTVSRAWK